MKVEIYSENDKNDGDCVDNYVNRDKFGNYTAVF